MDLLIAASADAVDAVPVTNDRAFSCAKDFFECSGLDVATVRIAQKFHLTHCTAI
jgi:hypothetical protein